MTSININETKPWKEFSDQRKHFIWHIFTLGASNKECGLLESNLLGIFVREVAKVIERASKNVQRNAELLCLLALGSVEVPKEKLSNREGLFVA